MATRMLKRRLEGNQSNFSVEQRVLALWPPNGLYYGGVVVDTRDGKCKIKYENNDVRWLLEHHVRADPTGSPKEGKMAEENYIGLSAQGMLAKGDAVDQYTEGDAVKRSTEVMLVTGDAVEQFTEAITVKGGAAERSTEDMLAKGDAVELSTEVITSIEDAVETFADLEGMIVMGDVVQSSTDGMAVKDDADNVSDGYDGVKSSSVWVPNNYITLGSPIPIPGNFHALSLRSIGSNSDSEYAPLSNNETDSSSEYTPQSDSETDSKTDSETDSETDSDSEYAPQSDSESGSDSEHLLLSNHLPRNPVGSTYSEKKTPVISRGDVSQTVTKTNNYDTRESIPTSSDDVPSTSTLFDRAKSHDITVMPNLNARHKSKKQCCYYCSGLFSELPRHLENKHAEETEVNKVMSLTGTARQQHLKRLRNMGNHRHNCEVFRKRSGSLIVVYRSSKHADPNKYGPCPYCFGYYLRRDLWRHKCQEKPVKVEGKRNGILRHSDLFKAPPNGISQAVNELFNDMKRDQVFQVCKTDQLLQEFAKREYMKVGRDQVLKDQHNYIRANLRGLGRLLLQLRKQVGKPNASLQDFLCPSKFQEVCKAVHGVAEFDEKTHFYKCPSLARKLGHSLKKLAVILKSVALEGGDKSGVSEAVDFLFLCDSNWNVFVSKHALRTLHEAKKIDQEVLPTNEDIVKMRNYLEAKGSEQINTLKMCQDETISSKAWDNLNEVLLCEIMMFNHRRAGQVSKMKIAEYRRSCKATEQRRYEEYEQLSKMEQSLCRMMDVVEVTGKEGRHVPILLTPTLKERLEIHIVAREKLVTETNEYVFARANYQSNGHIRGSDCMRKISTEAGLKNPHSPCSKVLRKQVATAAQLLDLSPDQVDLLAGFMGYNITVHKEYNQLPDPVLQVTLLSRIFLLMERDKLAAQRGKSLEALDVFIKESNDRGAAVGVSATVDDEATSSSDNDEAAFSSDDVDFIGETTQRHQTRHLAVKRNKPKRQKSHAVSSCTKRSTSLTSKRKWNKVEIRAIRTLSCVLALRLPGKLEIEELKSKYPVLNARTWRNIKDYMRNNKKTLLKYAK